MKMHINNLFGEALLVEGEVKGIVPVKPENIIS